MISYARQIFRELNEVMKNVKILTLGQVVIEEPINSTNSGDFQFFISVTPKEGYYVGATVKFKIEVPLTYPTKAPYVNCLNRIYHPNIDLDDGGVCVNLLDQDWRPEVGLDGCIMAILFLFYHPNCEDALSTVFSGEPMDDLEFHANVRAALRGEAIEGVIFDNLLHDGSQSSQQLSNNKQIHEPAKISNEFSNKCVNEHSVNKKLSLQS